MSNRSEKAEHILRESLGKAFPNAEREIEAVAGGFVVALVSSAFGHPDFSERESARKLVDEIWKANATTDEPDRVVVFEVKFFSSERAAYGEQAQLRTQPTKWENGHPVFMTTSQDAWVLAHTVDAEALLIDPISKQTCRVIQDPDFPMFRLGSRRFAQLDLGGSTFPVREVEQQQDHWVVHFIENGTAEV